MARVKSDIKALDNVLARLDDLSTPGSTGCGISDDVKAAVRLYVQTWIVPVVKGVRDDLAGTEALPEWLTRY